MSGIVAFAREVEELGFHYLSMYEHVLGASRSHHDVAGPYDERSPFHEPLVLFGYLAAVTERVVLTTGILVLPQRQTALVAKQAAEVSILSGGRFILGVGVGWNHAEYEGLGQDFATRGERIEEQIALLRSLWSEPLVHLDGKFDSVLGSGIAPRPSHPIPVWMGGSSGRVLARVGRLADGWLTPAAHPATAQRLAPDVSAQRITSVARLRELRSVIDESARTAGRDPEQIAVCLSLPLNDGEALVAPEVVAESIQFWSDAGASDVMLIFQDAALPFPDGHLESLRSVASGCRPWLRTGS